MPTSTSRGWPVMSSLFLFVGAIYYCLGVLQVARMSWWLEALVTLGFLAISAPFFARDSDLGARLRLIASETLFLLIAIGLRAAAALGHAPTGRIFDHAFALFFLVQVSGFLVQQVKEKSWTTVPMSLMMGGGLLSLYLRGQGASASAEGVVHFWGGDVPWALKGMYAAWILGVLLFDYGHVLPKATVLVVHLASFLVAISSPDFFHARVVSAYSLFLLNAVLVYANPAFISADFAVLRPLNALRPGEEGSAGARRAVGAVLNLACAASLGLLLWG